MYRPTNHGFESKGTCVEGVEEERGKCNHIIISKIQNILKENIG